MKAARSTSPNDKIEVETLIGVQNWQPFKRSFLEYVVRFQFVRSSLVDLCEPDWNGRFQECLKTLSLLQVTQDADNTSGDEASALPAKNVPPAKSTRKAKAGVKGDDITSDEGGSMRILIQKKAMEKVSKEQSDFETNCHTALGVLFARLSLTVKNTLEAKHSDIESWRNEGKLISIWEALASLYGMRNTVFPRMLKISAES